ncbi:hypothetical protein HanRHA438_Chr12g0566351 [Helianthus annuus]|uniref:Uncharacterized protein n=1 Tax=Helianthus annuus TaxID=4232 RepID=A0A9K3MX51_HELAN|nr:hypothetical protein HanXRQr2_Chr12g0554891 [Helianthus annuus]KAJ0490385.1 hypothetical protein HanHA300_Chr12g0454851 [Helianthus annuus]KAJ0494577.1 hypothetical protein HanIR_Chr12g0599041 [Helianthus annuus]KAJ0506304.1 hypothetical protein HanHA89_Chr12g0480441 [Helianthus annuus]KAJ0675977.1 hypothetical protein HanLR1_Chr12g0457371 [Helianthus annuus]
MDDLDNCHELYSMSLPPAEWLYQKNHDRFHLLDDHVRSGVNFFATTHEIVREWRSMGEDIMDFESAKREFAAERDTFNSEKKGLNWRVLDAEDKLVKERALHTERQKEWTSACERSNHDLKAALDEVVKVKGERDAESREVERMSALVKEKETQVVETQKSHAEALAWIAELERVVDDHQNQNKTLELLSQELGNDCKWLLTRGVPLLADRLVGSEELAKYMIELGDSGRNDGYVEGKAFAKAGTHDEKFELFTEDCAANYTTKCHEFGFLEFGILRLLRS